MAKRGSIFRMLCVLLLTRRRNSANRSYFEYKLGCFNFIFLCCVLCVYICVSIHSCNGVFFSLSCLLSFVQMKVSVHNVCVCTFFSYSFQRMFQQITSFWQHTHLTIRPCRSVGAHFINESETRLFNWYSQCCVICAIYLMWLRAVVCSFCCFFFFLGKQANEHKLSSIRNKTSVHTKQRSDIQFTVITHGNLNQSHFHLHDKSNQLHFPPTLNCSFRCQVSSTRQMTRKNKFSKLFQ